MGDGPLSPNLQWTGCSGPSSPGWGWAHHCLYSLHSLHHGGLQDGMAADIPLSCLQLHSDHRSEATQAYLHLPTGNRVCVAQKMANKLAKSVRKLWFSSSRRKESVCYWVCRKNLAEPITILCFMSDLSPRCGQVMSLKFLHRARFYKVFFWIRGSILWHRTI